MGIEGLPDLGKHEDVANFFGVSAKSVQNAPKRYGGKKIRGVGWRYPKPAVLAIAGLTKGPGR